jgi:phospholipid/cholesterol/gamma-HCH transport system substrate-binding protein
MRRAALLAAVIASAGLAVLVIVGAGTSSGYRFQAVFDTAQGMVAGQDVEVAGAKVGTVVAIHLTPDLKARMEFQIDSRFGPFHRDASCRILPKGLISENYVECDPGNSAAPPLGREIGGLPTVPVTQTTEPVTLQDLLNIFSYPSSARLSLMLGELGIATAGEGENINAILRRANPALTQARQVLSIIDAQSQQVAAAVGQTDQVIAQLAVRNGQVRSFVDNAATVAETTAAHRTALGEGVRRLPALLESVRSSFGALNDFSVSATPLLTDLRASAPGLTTLTSALPRFVSAAGPAIRTLGTAAAQGTVAAHTAAPVVSDLESFTSRAGPTAKLLDQLLISLRDRGAIEGVLNFVYGLAAAGGSYDSLAHMATIDLLFPPCLASQSYPGCDANFHRPAAAQASIPAATQSKRSTVRAPSAPKPPAQPPATSSLQGLLSYLLK